MEVLIETLSLVDLKENSNFEAGSWFVAHRVPLDSSVVRAGLSLESLYLGLFLSAGTEFCVTTVHVQDLRENS